MLTVLFFLPLRAFVLAVEGGKKSQPVFYRSIFYHLQYFQEFSLLALLNLQFFHTVESGDKQEHIIIFPCFCVCNVPQIVQII